MNSYSNIFTTGESYVTFWGKYRPVLLKLMISSAEGTQQYKFSAHEVRAANPKDKVGISFTLKMHKGKPINDIRTSLIAKDLMRVLQQSGKASELSESCIYEFKLDRHFVLHVTKTEVQIDPEKDQSIVTEHIEG